jgi:hypothetical protein
MKKLQNIFVLFALIGMYIRDNQSEKSQSWRDAILRMFLFSHITKETGRFLVRLGFAEYNDKGHIVIADFGRDTVNNLFSFRPGKDGRNSQLVLNFRGIFNTAWCTNLAESSEAISNNMAATNAALQGTIVALETEVTNKEGALVFPQIHDKTGENRSLSLAERVAIALIQVNAILYPKASVSTIIEWSRDAFYSKHSRFAQFITFQDTARWDMLYDIAVGIPTSSQGEQSSDSTQPTEAPVVVAEKPKPVTVKKSTKKVVKPTVVEEPVATASFLDEEDFA